MDLPEGIESDQWMAGEYENYIFISGKPQELHPSAVSLTKDPQNLETLLTNTVYVFLVLVLATMVLAGISFGIREYCISMRKAIMVRKEEQEEEIPEHESVASASPEVVDQNSSFLQPKPTGELVQEINTQQHKHVPKKDAGKVVPREVFGNITSGPSIDSEPMEELDSGDTVEHARYGKTDESNRIYPKIEQIKVFYDEVDSPGLNGESIAKFLEKQFSEKPATRIKYSYRELHNIRKSIQHGRLSINDKSKGKLTMNIIMRFTTPLPSTKFESAWAAEKYIGELKSVLTKSYQESTATSQIYIFSLLSVCVSHEPFDNPNYFLPSFTELLSLLLDSGDIFKLLEIVEQESQKLLVELMVIHFWSQWTFRTKSMPGIILQYEKWKFEPSVLPHQFVFRHICNFALGLDGCNFFDTYQAESKFKVHVVLKEAAKTAHCNEYISIIPMIAQTVGVSEDTKTKHRLYDALKVLIECHTDCCMPNYLMEESTDLRALVQHGLWHRHDKKICNKAREILHFLELRNKNVTTWLEEVDDGHTYLPASAFDLETATTVQMHTAPQRPSTPGSWNVVGSRSISRSISRAGTRQR